jgi:glycosyltransferase involved in cell wall biosynthesis
MDQARAKRVLFVSWDGTAQQYMESLFFPILSRASDASLRFGVCQFSAADAQARDKTAQVARSLGLDYLGHGVASLPKQLVVPAMIARGAQVLIDQLDRQRWDALMPRSIIPAAMCLLAKRARPHVELIFDADGLMADERVDFAGWSPRGLTYRLFRDWEAQALRVASAVIVRTTHAKRILHARAGADCPLDKLHVIPNAKDDALFRPLDPTTRAQLRARYHIAPEAPWIVYAGSLGPHYHLDAMLRLFKHILHTRPDAHLLLLSGMRPVAEHALATHHPSLANRVHITRVAPDEVAPLLGAADLGLSFREPSFSQQAVCPIKVAEYLLCGLPVIVNSGVGDLDERLAHLDALCLLDDLSDASLTRAASWFTHAHSHHSEALRAHARDAGLREFALGPCAHALRAACLGTSPHLPTSGAS